MDKKSKLLSYFTVLSVFVYFILLLTERLISIILTGTNGISYFGNAFNTYCFLTVFVSIAVWLVYLILTCRDAVAYLFGAKVNVPYKKLAIASGMLLVSGMVHTPFTTGWLQFVSYGVLIVGMLLFVLNYRPTLPSVLSFIYLVSFSMAIPVVYRSYIATHTSFHIVEAATSWILVLAFTYLFYRMFEGTGENLFLFLPFGLAVALDALLLAWRWAEEINYFVLVALIATAIMFVVGKIVTHKKVN